MVWEWRGFMNVNVLLAGATGQIGQNLVKSLNEECTLFTISKYPKKQYIQQVNWIKGDIYNYEDVCNAMKDIDIAVFYLDPTKHSAKVTKALAKELNLLAADNFARAAHQQQVKEIVYVKGSQFDTQTITQLQAYGTPVRCTTQQMKRSLISVEFQVAKYNDIRMIHHIPKPPHWTVQAVINYFFNWLSRTVGTRVYARQQGTHISIFKKRTHQRIMVLEIVKYDDTLYRLIIVKDRMSRKVEKHQPVLEFRYIPQKNWVMIHLFDYIPRYIWPIAYLIQIPYFKMLLRGFDTKCRIQAYQYKIKNGEKPRYTKD